MGLGNNATHSRRRQHRRDPAKTKREVRRYLHEVKRVTQAARVKGIR